MSWAAFRPSSAAWRVRAVSLTFSSNCFRSALSRRYPLTGRGLRCLGGRPRLVLGETARLSEIRAYKLVSPWLSRMIHLARLDGGLQGGRTGDGPIRWLRPREPERSRPEPPRPLRGRATDSLP